MLAEAATRGQKTHTPGPALFSGSPWGVSALQGAELGPRVHPGHTWQGCEGLEETWLRARVWRALTGALLT